MRHHWRGAHGNRDRSWGPRRWGGPTMWRWFSINVGEETALRGHPPGDRGGRPAPGLGVGRRPGHQRGRVAGAHRAGRRRRDPAGGASGRRRQGGPHLRPARRRAAGGRHRAGRRHHGQRGPGPLDLQRSGRPGAAPATASASTCTSSTTAGGQSSPSPDPCRRRPPRGLADALGRAPGRRRCATCVGSRAGPRGSPAPSTSSAAGGAPVPSSSSRTGVTGPGRADGPAWRPPCCAAAARPASRCPGWWRWARPTTSGRPGWWSSGWTGETIPRKILRDPEWAGRAGRPHGAVRAGAGRHPRHRPGDHRGLPPADPLRRPAALARCAG